MATLKKPQFMAANLQRPIAENKRCPVADKLLQQTKLTLFAGDRPAPKLKPAPCNAQQPPQSGGLTPGGCNASESGVVAGVLGGPRGNVLFIRKNKVDNGPNGGHFTSSMPTTASTMASASTEISSSQTSTVDTHRGPAVMVIDSGTAKQDQSHRVPPNAANCWNWRSRMNDDEQVESKESTLSHEQAQMSVNGFHLESSHYIRTPGNHLIDLNDFWMSVDKDARAKAEWPQFSDFTTYAQDVYHTWRQIEESLGETINHCYETMVCGANGETSDFEKYRVYSVTWVFRTATSLGFGPGVIHYAVYNLNRAFKLLKDGGHKISLPLFFGILSACLRVAVKHDESFERQYRVKYEARAAFSVSSELEVHLSVPKINDIESRLIGFLSSPMLPPSSLDFLDRYVRVGQWPADVVTKARALAHYCLDLSLFAGKKAILRPTNGGQQIHMKPSLLAASALALAVKIIGAMQSARYEPWPLRLEVYTGYGMTELTPGISSLSFLLRNKPQGVRQ